MTDSASPDQNAQDLFAGWLERFEEGEEEDIEALCRRHPRVAAGVRTLHRRWRRLDSAWPRAGEGRGDEEPVPVEFPSDVLTRLLGKPPAPTRYSVRGEVARGGMGRVLRVWDEELRRPLAMKVMLARGAGGASQDTPGIDPRILTRFLEEAQITGQLDHPGIVPVHELGLDAEGRVYFTMKLVQGRTLGDVFDELARGEEGWTRTRVLGLLLRVCEAVSYAHAKGVIHRDLKPSNIMVGRFGEVYVMDWGVAKVVARESGEPVPVPPRDGDSPLLTMEGDVIGTPAYMPPEQARGELGAVGPRSDVYAVGAMLYHLLAGRMPYVERDEAPGRHAIWRRVQEGPPRPLQEVAPDAPAELVALCEKAMAPDIGQRYPEMSALAADLTAFVEGHVVSAYETGAWAEARKWIRRNRALASSVAAAALAVLAGAVAFAFKAEEATGLAGRLQSNLDLAQARLLPVEAQDLWPPFPSTIAALEEWMERAQRLTAKLADHRRTLQELRTRALPWTDEERLRDEADHPRADELVRKEDELRHLQGLPRQEDLSARDLSIVNERRALLESEIAELARVVESRRTWTFGSVQDQRRHDSLSTLVMALESLIAGPLNAGAGWSVPKRLAFARDQRDGFAPGGRHARAWAEALPAIRRAYPGLDPKPQLGLLPIGPDPGSGLWEFAHLMSGVPAERGGDGNLSITEQTGIVLVLIPGGSFLMGSQGGDDPAVPHYVADAKPWEGPVHEVELSPFFLSKYEMTVEQWTRLTGETLPFMPSYVEDPARLPVQSITWQECFTWLARSGLILPSEAQWEYAARAGTDTPWFTGAGRDSVWEQHAGNLACMTAVAMKLDAPDIQNDPEKADGFGFCAPVGSFAPNPFGLHDVLGNVSEFCLDGSSPRFYALSPRKDPVSPWEEAQSVFHRGGSWYDNALHARSSRRLDRLKRSPNSGLGVRPARGLEP